MTAFADLVLNDGLTTPVARTFKARANVGGKWTWKYELGGAPSMGYPTCTTQTYFSKDLNGVNRHEFITRIPTPDTVVAGVAPKLAYFCEARTSFTTSERSTAAERGDLLAFHANFLASVRAKEIVVQNDPPR